jgi:hypothetical protein
MGDLLLDYGLMVVTELWMNHQKKKDHQNTLTRGSPSQTANNNTANNYLDNDSSSNSANDIETTSISLKG